MFIRNNRMARKDHTCALCGRTIARGEVYLRGVNIDGGVQEWKECAHCEVLFTYLLHLWGEDEYCWDLVYEWEVETYWQARVKVYALRRWQRPDGTLYPVPTIMPSGLVRTTRDIAIVRVD